MSERIRSYNIGNLNKEAENPTWRGFYNSRLLAEDGEDFDARYSSFQKWFGDTLPRGYKNIKDYLEKVYESKNGRVILVELGGPGSKLVADFSPNFLGRSLGVTLTDQRSTEEKLVDQKLRHTLIEANIFKDFEKISEWLGEEKADIIFERMTAAWEDVPERMSLWGAWLNKYYRMLSPEGVMFFETPTLHEDKKEKILDWYKKNMYRKQSGIELDGVEMLGHDYFRLKKTKDAPESLFNAKK